MKVNFNGLRRRLADSYNSLTRELNRHVDKDGEGMGAGSTLVTGDIRDQMDNLREYIGTIISLEGGEDDFKALEIDLVEFAPGEDAA